MTTSTDDERRAYEVVARLGEKLRHAAGLADIPEMSAPRRTLDENAISPALLAHLEQHEHRAKQLAFSPTIASQPFVPLTLRKTATEAREPRERELDYELSQAMKERVPQALLRDLHRPVSEFSIRYEIDEASAQQLEDRHITPKEIMATSYGFTPTTASVLALPQQLRDLQDMIKTTRWSISGKDT